jgi:CPA2 family monovalent cation:H+ antiporter-2
MFAAIFFVSIGALVNVTLVPQYILPAAILILTSFGAKFLIVTGILSRAKYDSITALRTGFGMSAAKGELSLVVVKGGQDVGAITSSVLPILGVVTIVTTFMAPYIIRFGSRIRIQSSSDDDDGDEDSSSKSAEEKAGG